MKVILTQELKGTGGEGDVVDVARGYAVNYLLPRRLAVEATPGNLKQFEARRGNILKREEARVGEARSLAERLVGGRVVVVAKAGDEGRLFGSVTSAMVVNAIAEQLDVDVDRRKIDVHGHIKTLGEHAVTVQVYRDIKTEVIVAVIPEGESDAAAGSSEPVAVVKDEAEAPLENDEPELAEELDEESAG